MTTLVSMTTFLSRTLRWMWTDGSTTASSSEVKELTRTLGDRMVRLIEAPDTMQPPETSEATAAPRRPSRSCTNFAGGVTSE